MKYSMFPGSITAWGRFTGNLSRMLPGPVRLQPWSNQRIKQKQSLSLRLTVLFVEFEIGLQWFKIHTLHREATSIIPIPLSSASHSPPSFPAGEHAPHALASQYHSTSLRVRKASYFSFREQPPRTGQDMMRLMIPIPYMPQATVSEAEPQKQAMGTIL